MNRPLFRICVLLFSIFFLLLACRKHQPSDDGDEFLRLSNVGKAHLDRGESQASLDAFEKAIALNPNHSDARLNLANAHLLAGNNARARALANSVLQQERASAPANYISGVAALREGEYTNAIQLLQQAKDIDIRENAVSLQLGMAYEGLGRFDEALAQYEEIAQFDPGFPGVHFRLAEVYRRLGRDSERKAQLEAHAAWIARNPTANLTAAGLAQSKYTEARIPFRLEQPDRESIKVVFTEVTSEVLGGKFSGPVGVIDFARDGTNHLLVRDGESFRVLLNRGGKFTTNQQAFPFTNGGNYVRWLVADLNKDAVPDALVLGDQGVHLYRFTSNGIATETTVFAGLKDFVAIDGVFADLNFRGDLDLVSVNTNGALRIMSNLQNMYFMDTSTNAPGVTSVHQLALDDWNNDEMQDLFVSDGKGGAPRLLLKQRGGSWSNHMLHLPRFAVIGGDMPRSGSTNRWQQGGRIIAVGDANNDLRPDLLMVAGGGVDISFNGASNQTSFALNGFLPTGLKLIDYDNDGWLDVFALGSGLRVFRNLGTNGFKDVTAGLGLQNLLGDIESFVAADLDGDCDTDIIVSTPGSGVQVLRNDGGNKNHQLRIALHGTRSNSSGLGVRIDVAAGGLRVGRRVHELPIEIGVGKHQQLDAVNAHWFELSPSYTELNLTNCEPLRIIELALPTGSCPYLYSDDANATRFLTDLLCSSPLGLPIAAGKYVEADEDEIVWIANEKDFRPRFVSRERKKEQNSPGFRSADCYVLRITEELREVLYLDEAKLIVVDHPPGTEVHSTTKMLPGKSSHGFGTHEVVMLHNRVPLRMAMNNADMDVTRAVLDIDDSFASPRQLREPQLRGLAEPHSITVDFGDLPKGKSLVLALSGWLRFGGGMANMAASTYSDFPFPFPVLEAEVDGKWQRVNVELGAPSGRAKTIITDLGNKVPPGSRRLRVTAALEIHWDRIALFERAEHAPTALRLSPTRTELRWRGYSDMVTVSSRPMLVPDYARTRPFPLWRIAPSGWATRYGEVDDLIASRDNALALICGGDELALEFAADKIPSKPAGMDRDFFLFVSGWDKDSDFHVVTGTTIEPLPWHGMNYQTYGSTPRPAFTNDSWIQKYNTRWVGNQILTRRN